MSVYQFQVEVTQEEDGRWSAVCWALPGCATWGYTRDEAVLSLEEAIWAYLEVLQEDGVQLRDPVTGIKLVPPTEVVLPMPIDSL